MTTHNTITQHTTQLHNTPHSDTTHHTVSQHTTHLHNTPHTYTTHHTVTQHTTQSHNTCKERSYYTLYPVTKINWAIKIKDELMSFINIRAQLYLPAEEPGGGWNRFYKLTHVETLVRKPG